MAAAMPTYIGRWSTRLVRPEAGVDSTIPPDISLKGVSFKYVIYEPTALRHLVERVGVDRVVLGTDYPFDMGYIDERSHDVARLT